MYLKFSIKLCYKILAKICHQDATLFIHSMLQYKVITGHKPSYRVFSFLFLDMSGFCPSLEVFFLWWVVLERNLRGIVENMNVKVDRTCLARAGG